MKIIIAFFLVCFAALGQPANSPVQYNTTTKLTVPSGLVLQSGTATENPTTALGLVTKQYEDALKIPSIAELSALNGSASAGFVNLLGYSSPGDGGGGLLYWTNCLASTTNQGTRYAALGGGGWQRVVFTPANPRWFGAVGDWNTDDTAAFNLAGNTIDPTISNTNQYQIRVEVTPGWYKVRNLVFSNKTELYGTLKVRGSASFNTSPVIFQAAGSTGPMIRNINFGLNIHDLQMSGRASANIQNSNTIATVSSRLSFSVSSTNNLPPRVLTNFPYGGPMLIYTTNGTLVGSALVESVTGTNVTIKPGSDWFSTGASSNLSTGWTVAFTPWKTWTNGYGASPYNTADPTNFYAPATCEIGNAAIELQGSSTFNVIRNCNISGFTVGVGGLGVNGLSVIDCNFYAIHLAGIQMDNCYDGIFDNLQITGQQLTNGAVENEYVSVGASGALNKGSAIADAPAVNTAYGNMRSAVGGWNLSSHIGHHWRCDGSAVAINWSGIGAIEVAALADVTADNTSTGLLVLEGSGYTKIDWLRSSTLYLIGGTAIKTYGAASFDITTFELSNVMNITPRWTYAVDTSAGTPGFTPILPNLLLLPSPGLLMADTNNVNNPVVNAFVTSSSAVSPTVRVGNPLPSNRSATAPFEALLGNGAAGTANFQAFNGGASLLLMSAGGTRTSPTVTENAVTSRLAFLGIDTNGSTNFIFGASFENFIPVSWNLTNHGMYTAMSGTPFNTTTRIVNVLNTGNGMAVGSTTATVPVASAVLELQSTTTGLLLPRMTTVQKNAISSPAEGLMIYDTTLHKVCIRVAAAWETITSL